VKKKTSDGDGGSDSVSSVSSDSSSDSENSDDEIEKLRNKIFNKSVSFLFLCGG